MEIFIDSTESGTFSLLESHNVSVPWPEVHVHLMGTSPLFDYFPKELLIKLIIILKSTVGG